ncbi:MAG: autotransporter domain-containing protein [Variovorax sp.]|nr:MAG: autotransporter domain-containing protein [Variovorax sp.]
MGWHARRGHFANSGHALRIWNHSLGHGAGRAGGAFASPECDRRRDRGDCPRHVCKPVERRDQSGRWNHQPGRNPRHVSGLQAGTDLLVSGDWRAGVYVGYLDGGADVSGNARGITSRVGSNDLQSRYLGAYATWMDASGFYVDSVLQGGSQRYTVRPDLNPSVSGKADSFAASVETGKPFALSERWSIEPQAQLIYQQVNPKDVTLSGAQVNHDADSGWIGRLGVRIQGDITTGAGRLLPYARLNLYRASFDSDVVTFIGPAGATAIASAGGYSAAEAAAGATLALTPTTSLYGEIGHLWDIGGDAAVKSSVQASLGVKVRW